MGTGILVNRADTLKDTSSSSLSMCTDLRYLLKHLLSLINEGVIPEYLLRILVKNFVRVFAVSSSKVPLTKYIAATKRICDELGENTVGKDCTDIYQNTKEVPQHFKDRRGTTAKRSGRPSNPSGKTPPIWSLQQTRV